MVSGEGYLDHMSRSQWAWIWPIILSPHQYRLELSEKKGPDSLRGIFIVILVVFTIYVMFFGYKSSILRISSGDPLEPYKPLLNKLVLGGIGAGGFLLWYLLDRLVLFVIIGSGRRSEVQNAVKVPLIASYIPLLPLLSLWTFLRMAYAGSYVAWGLWWMPVFTVGITLGWHYFLLHYLASALVVGIQQPRLKFGLIVWVMVIVGVLAAVVLVVPYFLEGTPEMALAYIF